MRRCGWRLRPPGGPLPLWADAQGLHVEQLLHGERIVHVDEAEVMGTNPRLLVGGRGSQAQVQTWRADDGPQEHVTRSYLVPDMSWLAVTRTRLRPDFPPSWPRRRAEGDGPPATGVRTRVAADIIDVCG